MHLQVSQLFKARETHEDVTGESCHVDGLQPHLAAVHHNANGIETFLP